MTHSLLQPRYIVEANYPNSPFRVGDILVVKHHSMYKDGEVFGLEDDDNVSSWITYAKDFPNIFRKLNWWEHRSLDEMPRWVRVNYVASIWLDFTPVVGDIIKCQFRLGEYGIEMQTETKLFNNMQLDSFTPATEEEYINYLKTK